MGIVVVGSNPGLALYAGSSVVAAANVWMVDWSVWGHGTVLLVANDDGWHTYGTDEHLARIMLERFTRHFAEMSAFIDSPVLPHINEEVDCDWDLQIGLRATVADVTVTLGDIKERRQFADPAFRLGDTVMGLSNVYAPCGAGSITIDGHDVPGVLQCQWRGDRWSSTGFLSAAEVWAESDQPVPTRPSTGRQGRWPRHLRAVSRPGHVPVSDEEH